MGVAARIRPLVRPTGVLGLTGAAPQTGAGGAINVVDCEPLTLSATVYSKATTNTLTITGKWQARNTTGGTWHDAYGPSNAVQVALVTGTGSAVTNTRVLAAPLAVYSAVQARFIVVSGVGVGGGAGVDEYNISYNYRQTLARYGRVIGPAATVAGFTGAAPQVVNGGVVAMGDLQPGTLCALVYGLATTNLLVLTGKWQVTDTPLSSGSWVDARQSHDPADVAIVTGTGSAVTDTRYITAPESVYGRRFARYVVTSTAASGNGLGQDECSIGYQYMRPFY